MAKNHRTRHQRHTFVFKFEETGQVFKSSAKVIVPKRDVHLPLKAEHVREAIRLQGVGNTQKCSMAVCARREAECFGHKVLGYIDWYYRRAFVASRLNKMGLPSECYVYAHSDGIGKLNDSKGGQQKLLTQLEAEGGERVIHLKIPPRSTGKNKKRDTRGRGHSDGSRSKPRGPKLRFGYAQLGGVPG